jgi:carboxyl-terminal processing protease
MINRNKKYFYFIGVLVLAVGIFIGMKIQTAVSNDKVNDSIRKYAEVLNLVSQYYVDTVDSEKLTESAINGLLQDLDPHSVYISTEQLKRVNEDFQGSFDGIGVEFDIINDTLTVISPISGGPSEALGIIAGDKIVKIDDKSAIKISREDVPKKLRGPKGTKVKLTIVRAGSPNLIDFDITRDKIPLYSVDASFMYDNEIGYIKVSRFAATTYSEFIQALNKLKGEGMKKLVLDLRGNPGGFLEQAVKISSEFLPAGDKIVYTQGRLSSFNEVYNSSGGSFTSTPLIVLVNEGSASASEIVSGAIQDWDRGLIVGETTFGKGLVQRQFELFDASALRLTTSRYYTPAGRTIQKPYEGGKYSKSATRNEGNEGDNLMHGNEKIDSTKPSAKTIHGRTVYGGGGITPDYIIKQDTLTSYTVSLRRLNILYQYTENLMSSERKNIEKDYSGFMDFAKNYKVTDKMLNDLIRLADSKGVKYDEANFNTDKVFIISLIKSQIARDIWGNEGSYAVFMLGDDVFLKAVTLFDEVMALMKL